MTVPDERPLMPPAAEDSILPLDGGSIYVREDGSRGKPALLLIHGSASSTRSWEPLIPLLRKG